MLTGTGDPVPTWDTRPSRAGTVTLSSALGAETACFRVFPEDTVVGTTSPSAVMPCRASQPAGDRSPVCWPLVCTTVSTKISPL